MASRLVTMASRFSKSNNRSALHWSIQKEQYVAGLYCTSPSSRSRMWQMCIVYSAPVYAVRAVCSRCVTHQHDHTPVEDASVVAVATGRAQERLLGDMATGGERRDERKKREKYIMSVRITCQLF